MTPENAEVNQLVDDLILEFDGDASLAVAMCTPGTRGQIVTVYGGVEMVAVPDVALKNVAAAREQLRRTILASVAAGSFAVAVVRISKEQDVTVNLVPAFRGTPGGEEFERQVIEHFGSRMGRDGGWKTYDE